MADAESNNPQQDTPEKKEAPAPTPELEKLLEKTAQSAADKVRTELYQKIKAKDEELEALRLEKMTAKERADHESKKLKDELEEKARKLNRKELELLATQELKENGLDIDFLDYVIGSDTDSTKDKIYKLKKTFDGALGKAVEGKIKAAGRDPSRGRDGTAGPGFAGMTPKEIQVKAHRDPEWFRKHEADILQAYADGTLKR